MPDGGCFCGATRIRYTGDIQAKALCHCTDCRKVRSLPFYSMLYTTLNLSNNCRKITGSTYSTNIIVPGDGFSVTAGKPKTISKKADSGSQITSHFCGDCGSTLFRDGPTFGDGKVIKVGVMDDPNALVSLVLDGRRLRT